MPDESLDLASVPILIDFLAAAGCRGVVALGVLGEPGHLADDERAAVIDAMLIAVAGRMQVSIGITH